MSGGNVETTFIARGQGANSRGGGGSASVQFQLGSSGFGKESSDYVKFFLGTKSSIVQYECIELIHPSFSKTYRIVRNNVEGITVTHEDDSDYAYEYYPLKITPSASRDDLDFSIKLEFGDLGETLPMELDRIRAAETFATKPIFKYRTYRSDNLVEVMFGPMVLEISEFAFDKDGAAFQAKAPSLNIATTGEIYSIDRFASLREFL